MNHYKDSLLKVGMAFPNIRSWSTPCIIWLRHWPWHPENCAIDMGTHRCSMLEKIIRIPFSQKYFWVYTNQIYNPVTKKTRNPPVGCEICAPKNPPKTDLFGLKFDAQTEGLTCRSLPGRPRSRNVWARQLHLVARRKISVELGFAWVAGKMKEHDDI